MKLNTINRIRREDLPKAPEWIDPIINILNNFIEQVYSAFNKDITFSENINCQIKTVLIKYTDFPYKFNCTLKVKPSCVFLGKVEKKSGAHETITNATSIDWLYDAGNIVVYNIAGIDATSQYYVTMLII